jgi:hypothetical protein
MGLDRVGLADAHEDDVIEHAFGRQREVHDLREVHLEDGQEEFHGRAAMMFFMSLVVNGFEIWRRSWK